MDGRAGLDGREEAEVGGRKLGGYLLAFLRRDICFDRVDGDGLLRHGVVFACGVAARSKISDIRGRGHRFFAVILFNPR
jgi:hypothetical protein